MCSLSKDLLSILSESTLGAGYEKMKIQYPSFKKFNLLREKQSCYSVMISQPESSLPGKNESSLSVAVGEDVTSRRHSSWSLKDRTVLSGTEGGGHSGWWCKGMVPFMRMATFSEGFPESVD